MSKIKVKVQTLDKNLEYVEKEMSIDVSEYDEKSQEIWYTLHVPSHVYNALLDTAPEYTLKKGFKQNIKSISIKTILDIYQSYCFEILNRKKIDTEIREKKIFVKFSHSAKHSRCEWTGGYKGETVGSSFQFFTGYKVMKPKKYTFEDETVEKIASYYTLICYQKQSEFTTVTRNDTNFEEGKKLHPLHMEHERKAFEEEYAILDWTQEAEDFLKMIQGRFKELHKYLDDFLGNLDNDKLQKLIQANNFKLLTK